MTEDTITGAQSADQQTGAGASAANVQDAASPTTGVNLGAAPTPPAPSESAQTSLLTDTLHTLLGLLHLHRQALRHVARELQAMGRNASHNFAEFFDHLEGIDQAEDDLSEYVSSLTGQSAPTKLAPAGLAPPGDPTANHPGAQKASVSLDVIAPDGEKGELSMVDDDKGEVEVTYEDGHRKWWPAHTVRDAQTGNPITPDAVKGAA